ncbi:hypothetical protein C5167_000265 [Papaver somniferum]|uniref:Uncharacterized protein n=1 Tax=Papaver somniferum TaxID=3469 RepID=A0A4Y7KS30_PAPSO|nr:protein ENHANCED PSEUDOMONAS SUSCEPTIBILTY 1-like [Papaver somniferum]RZC76153.1 hypothetical protein C5167_000265 [Papaver somniferum]
MSVSEVRRVSTTKVRPASYIHKSTDNFKRIDLNPWDILFLRQVYSQRGLLFAKSQSFPGRKDEDGKTNNIVISNMISSMSHTLDHFFPLAGRLGIKNNEDDNTVSVYINCNFEGAEIIHATADISVKEIVAQTYVPASVIDPLFSLNGVRNYEGQSHPLLSIQITELLDGVFIGCSVNHSVLDGTSFWNFINLWSEISRSSDNHTPCPHPVFERWFIKDTDCPIRLPFSVADEFSVGMNICNTKALVFKGHVEKIFHFTKENIAKLKARANSEIISETKQNTALISSLQAVLAHLWIAVLRARTIIDSTSDENEKTAFGFVTNNRSKLIPPLPEAYFGNSVSLLMITAKDDEVLQRGFGFLASLLNEVANSNTDGRIRSELERITEKPFIISDEAGNTKKDLCTRSSHRFNMYGNDFGWGRPIAVRTGIRGKSSGVTTVDEGPVEGSIDIGISLPIEVFEALENDAEFMKAFIF